jgi:hypothetical protein
MSSQPKRPQDDPSNRKALSRWENEGGAPEDSHPKRPRDVNQRAKRFVNLATGNGTERDPDAGKVPKAGALRPMGGLKSGKIAALRRKGRS